MKITKLPTKILMLMLPVVLVAFMMYPALADNWTADKAAQYVPVIGASGYWQDGKWVNGQIGRAQQDLFIWTLSLQTGVDMTELRKAVAKRNELFAKGQISAQDTLDVRAAKSPQMVLGQSSTGLNLLSSLTNAAGIANPLGGGTSSNQSQNSKDANAFTTRVDYFKRFPFAAAASRSDILVPLGRNRQTSLGRLQNILGNAGSNLSPSQVGQLQNLLEQPPSSGNNSQLQSMLNQAGISLSPTQITQLQTSLSRSSSKSNSDPTNDLQRSLGTSPINPRITEGQFFPVLAYTAVHDPITHYTQPPLVAIDIPATYRDLELFTTAMTGVNGLPLSDTQFQILDRENKQRLLELLYDPERFMWLTSMVRQMGGSQLSNSMAGASQTTFNNAYSAITGGLQSTANSGTGGTTDPNSIAAGATLINVANEHAASSTPSGSVSYAIYLVQRMYATVFVPMAILFLLPGAVLTQTKSLVARGIMGSSGEDASNPFEGILRAIVAIFLIPCTQLIVSYSIDIGNSLAGSVSPWVGQQAIFRWAGQQIYHLPPQNVRNAIMAGNENLPGLFNGSLPNGLGSIANGLANGNSLGSIASGLATGQGGLLSGATPGGFNPITGIAPGAISTAGGQPGGSGPSLATIAGGLVTSGVPGLTSATGGGAAPFHVSTGLGTQADSFVNGYLGNLFGGVLNSLGLTNSTNGSVGLMGQGGQGKAAQIPPEQTMFESQLWLSQIMQLGFNFVELFFSWIIIILTAYQLVFMCYLYLMGPLSASFFAWPAIGGESPLFKNVFSQWLNGVIQLSLWRFYWCVILAIMTQRLIYLQTQSAAGFNPNAQFEMMVFTCFLGLMLIVPFQPFNFDPGNAVMIVLSKGTQMGQTMAQGAGAAAKAAGVPAGVVDKATQMYGAAMQPMTKVSGEFMNAYQQQLYQGAATSQQLGGVGLPQGQSTPGAGASQPSTGALMPTGGGQNVGMPPITSFQSNQPVNPTQLPPSAPVITSGLSPAAAVAADQVGAGRVSDVTPPQPPMVSLLPTSTAAYMLTNNAQTAQNSFNTPSVQQMVQQSGIQLPPAATGTQASSIASATTSAPGTSSPNASPLLADNNVSSNSSPPSSPPSSSPPPSNPA